jgi:UDP-N-acetylmuramyl pentapeptide synthase
MPQSSFFASDVDFENGTFVFNGNSGEKITLPFQKGNFFNVFNITGTCAVCRLMGIDVETISNSVDDLSSKTGRFQENKFGGVEVISMLSKNQNPISCSQSLKYLNSTEDKKDVVLLITDSNDKVHGHEDISWLYDTDFSPLNSENVAKIYVGGSRCYDVANCLQIKGIDTDKLVLFEDYDELAAEVSRQSVADRSVVVYFELYATSVVAKIKNALSQKGDK